MANASLLFCTDHEGVPRQGRDDIAYFGRYNIPLFWLASLKPADVQYVVVDEGDKLPYVDASPGAMLTTFESRLGNLGAIAQGIDAHFPAWRRFLSSQACRYIKIDPSEIIFMEDFDPADFERGIAFFDDPSIEGFNSILSLTSLTDILEQSTKPPAVRPHPIVGGEFPLKVGSEVYLCGYEDSDFVRKRDTGR